MAATKRGLWWEILSSWWIILTLGAFCTNWIAFLYIGLKAKNHRWMLWSLFYFSPVFMLFFINEKSKNIYIPCFLIISVISGIMGIIHAFKVRKEYLIQISDSKEQLAQIKPDIKQSLYGIDDNISKIRKQISNAYWACIISASFTFIWIILSFWGVSILGINILNLVDVVIVLILAFGIYKKSRICAIILFVYFIAGQCLMRIDLKNSQSMTLGISSSLFFGYMYLQGIIGTFAYHKYLGQHKNEIGVSDIEIAQPWEKP